MHRREDDGNSSSLRPLDICCRLLKFVVAKITIHFKQIEDSKDNCKSKNNSPGSSSQESERETKITLANGTNGPKKRLLEKGKKITLGEPIPTQQITQPEAAKPPPQPHRRMMRPLLNDINKKSDAFIESTLEKMRKSLA